MSQQSTEQVRNIEARRKGKHQIYVVGLKTIKPLEPFGSVPEGEVTGSGRDRRVNGSAELVVFFEFYGVNMSTESAIALEEMDLVL